MRHPIRLHKKLSINERLRQRGVEVTKSMLIDALRGHSLERGQGAFVIEYHPTAAMEWLSATRDLYFDELTPSDDSGKLKVPDKPVEGDPVYASETTISHRNKEEVEGVFLIVDGLARFRPVKTGITGDMDIEVLSGLKDGEEVIIGPFKALRKLSEWDRVEIDKKKQASAIAVRRS